MCSTLLVETVESNNSTVYSLLIDASKTFDRLCHSKFLEHKMFALSVERLWYNIDSRSEMHVKWNSAHYSPFSLHN